MLQSIRARATARRDDERGFTLIELMVVVLIIAILLAIAIPTFLGAQNKAKDRSAQSALRNSISVAQTAYQDTQAFPVPVHTSLSSTEANISYVAGNVDSKDPNSVSAVATAQLFTAAAWSKAGNCFFVKIDQTINGTTNGTYFAKVANDDGTNCQADKAPAGVGAPWKKGSF